MLLLQSRPGSAVAIRDSVIQCQTKFFYLSRPRISFSTETSIVNSIGISEAVNAQFTHTFGAHVYCYVFGDQMGTIRVSGISFACGCDNNSFNKHGAESMLLWYRRHRASKRRTPVQVMLGETSVEGLMTSVNINSVDPGANLASWDMTIRVLPDDQFDADVGTPDFDDIGFTGSPLLQVPEQNIFPPAPPWVDQVTGPAVYPPNPFPPVQPPPPWLDDTVGPAVFPPTPPGLFDTPQVTFPPTPPGLFDEQPSFVDPPGVAAPDFTPLFPPEGSVDGIPVDLVDFSEPSTEDPGTIFLPPVIPNPLPTWPPFVLRTPPEFSYSPEN